MSHPDEKLNEALIAESRKHLYDMNLSASHTNQAPTGFRDYGEMDRIRKASLKPNGCGPVARDALWVIHDLRTQLAEAEERAGRMEEALTRIKNYKVSNWNRVHVYNASEMQEIATNALAEPDAEAKP